jgi:2-phosphoglycerate kinase
LSDCPETCPILLRVYESAMNQTKPRAVRPWEVLLIGGASGSGKTSISYRLADHFKVGITEVDDFQVILERMTTPEQQPELHWWRTHPEAINLPATEIVQHTIAVCRAMAPALEAVIANHLKSHAPVVLEGDFVLPALVAQTSFCGYPSNAQVKAIVIEEDDEQQLLSNFAERESAVQAVRARVSWLYGRWLKQEAEASGAIVVPSRPWDTLFERVLQAIA